MRLTGARIVVTGGAGFIGSHVVDVLVKEGISVKVADDLSAGAKDHLSAALAAGAGLAVGDVRDYEFIRDVCDGADIVIHMACANLRASLGAPLESHERNATAALVTALAARAAGVARFIYVSSSEAYGTACADRMTESHRLNPTTVYGAAKAAGEMYALGVASAYGLPATIVRPFNAYGPRSHGQGTNAEVIPRFVRCVRAGMSPVVYGDGAQSRDFTWVEETALGIVKAASCDSLVGRAVNIASGHEVTVRKVASLVLSALDREDLGIVHAPARPGDVRRHLADVGLARETLGFAAQVGIEEGLRRYIAWAVANEQLAPGDAGGCGDQNWQLAEQVPAGLLASGVQG